MSLVEAPAKRDDPAIERLLREPMSGPITFALHAVGDRHADAARRGDRHLERVARREHNAEPLGYAARSVRELWINGNEQRIGYLHGLRTKSSLRITSRLMRDAFVSLAGTRSDIEATYDFTSIMDDNIVARRLLERGLPGMPRYTPVGSMITMVMRVRPTRRSASRRTGVDHASFDDVKQMLRAHDSQWDLRPAWAQPPASSPSIHFFAMRNGNRVTGCAALWDQRTSQALTVHRYAWPLRTARPLINVASRFTGRPTLPAAGRPLAMAFLSHLACDIDDPSSAESLIRAVHHLASLRGLTHVIMGIPEQHALCEPIRKMFRPYELKSTIYAVHDADAPHPELDEVWPEIAVL